MKPLGFDWGAGKATANLRKHRVSFIEASTVFEDENALFLADPAHSEEEERFLILGVTTRSRVLIVAHCYREEAEVIRIISARKAPVGQQQTYQRRKR